MLTGHLPAHPVIASQHTLHMAPPARRTVNSGDTATAKKTSHHNNNTHTVRKKPKKTKQPATAKKLKWVRKPAKEPFALLLLPSELVFAVMSFMEPQQLCKLEQGGHLHIG